MFCLWEPRPEGPLYVSWFALNHAVHGRTLLSKLIVKAAAPRSSLLLRNGAGSNNHPAKRSRGHSATHGNKYYQQTKWNILLWNSFWPHTLERLLAGIQAATAVNGSWRGQCNIQWVASVLDTPSLPKVKVNMYVNAICRQKSNIKLIKNSSRSPTCPKRWEEQSAAGMSLKTWKWVSISALLLQSLVLKSMGFCFIELRKKFKKNSNCGLK